MLKIQGDQRQLQEIVSFIASLPPGDLPDWQELSKFNPEVALNIESSWLGIAKGLRAFFAEESNPIPSFNISEKVKVYIQRRVNFYSVLSVVMFEAEHLIKEEAIAHGFDFFKERTFRDFVSLWALEECRQDIRFYLQEFWESQSCKNVSDRQRDCKKIADGEISPEVAKLRFARWDKEDSKLYRPGNDEIERLRIWQRFFVAVFSIHREKIGSLKALESMIFDQIPPELFNRKFAINDGRIQNYPGRH